MTQYDLKECRKTLKKELDKSRYEHTLGVMYTCGALAMRYGVDLNHAMTAGLLHDCAKCIPDARKLELCRKNGIAITEIEEQQPFLLHAKLGAYLAAEEYGVREPEILSAIACHSTGKPGMSLLDKIVFLADYIEPGRDKAANLKEIRAKAFVDLNGALLQTLRDTLVYLEERGEPIDETTRRTYEYYQEKQENEVAGGE